MKPAELAREVEVRTGVKSVVWVALLGSIFTNVGLAFLLNTIDRTHRETIVPPEINKSFWVEDKHVSASYLEQMGLYVLMNALNVTPATADYQMQQLLKLASPRAYGPMEASLKRQVDRLRRDKVSTAVGVTGISVDEAKQAVYYDVVLSTMVSDKSVSQVPKKFEISFSMSQGRIRLEVMREIDDKGQPISAAADARS